MDKEINSLVEPGSTTISLVQCPGMGQSPQDWHRPKTPQHTEGKLVCYFLYPRTSSEPAVVWTIDSELLLGFAQGPGGGSIDQVYQWWAARYQ